MPDRRRLLVGLVGVSLWCLIGAGCGGKKAETTAPATPSGAPPAAEAAAVKVGDPTAPVKLVAFYPMNEGHKYIVDYLKNFAEAHPGKVYLEVIDFQTPQGVKRWEATGLKCAGVLVNGKTQHEITTNGKTETVNFIQRLDVFWTREDFEKVVNNLLAEAGKPGQPAGAEKGAPSEKEAKSRAAD